MANVKLTPAIKHLLALRSPNALPSPPLAQLNRVFTNTFRDATAKKAETGWLVATVRVNSECSSCSSPYNLLNSLSLTRHMHPPLLDLFPLDSQPAFSCGPPVPFRHQVHRGRVRQTECAGSPKCGEQGGPHA
jgi:hypothetical protein